METEFKKIEINPIVAQRILKDNIGNRNPSEKAVNMYAKDMEEGRWKINTGDTIKISKTNRLLDGQHRLLAIIKSNKTFEFTVAYNVPDDVFDVIDTNKNRSKNDVFAIAKIPNSSACSSIINSYLSLKKGNSTTEGKSSTGITNTIILDKYKENAEHWQDVSKFSIKIYNSFAKILPLATIGSFYALFYDINPQDAREFFNQVGTGENVTNNSISLLRKALLNDKVASRKITTRHKNALIIKSWNAFRKNDHFKSLRFDSDSDLFPKPI